MVKYSWQNHGRECVGVHRSKYLKLPIIEYGGSSKTMKLTYVFCVFTKTWQQRTPPVKFSVTLCSAHHPITHIRKTAPFPTLFNFPHGIYRLSRLSLSYLSSITCKFNGSMHCLFSFLKKQSCSLLYFVEPRTLLWPTASPPQMFTASIDV